MSSSNDSAGSDIQTTPTPRTEAMRPGLCKPGLLLPGTQLYQAGRRQAGDLQTGAPLINLRSTRRLSGLAPPSDRPPSPDVALSTVGHAFIKEGRQRRTFVEEEEGRHGCRYKGHERTQVTKGALKSGGDEGREQGERIKQGCYGNK
ncbi:hypothetical protein DPEC_G00079050 [Dallia pectoralis]|uniref:Uncharacterized protein n=1 Tax=Dallia pectoralis TaxID=75939 RepID=A0ACC2H4W5_DALPE|nr:hypothetical protein DPEC_G00079050 [Dallia pectoralis]